jgi:hypothetical protein
MTIRRIRIIAMIVIVIGSMFALSGLGPVGAGHTPGTTVHVDDDCDDPGDGTPGDPFCTVQEGVAHANAGDTVSVAAGTYVEAGQIVIDKNLTVTGAGSGATVIMTDSDTGTGGDSRGWILVESGIVFGVADLTLDGAGHKIWQAIRHHGAGSVDGVRFTNIAYQVSGQPYGGTGIAAFGTGPVHVSDSAFGGIGRIGLQYFGSGVSGSVADGNTFVGKGSGDWLDYGIEVSNGAQITATNNSISGNRGVASSDGSSSAGILVTTFFGGGSAAVIENNELSDNTTAIYVGFDGSDTSMVAAHQNNITGNDFGVVTTAPAVDATCNWWGSVSGPENATSNPDGEGDSADDGVTFEPWLTGEAPGGNCNGPLLNPETKDDCKRGGWRDYGFRNQGQCIRYVNTGYDSRLE